MIKTTLSFALVTLMMKFLVASPIIFESNSDNSTITGWSENTQIGRDNDGNQYLQVTSNDYTGNSKAIASLAFSPVKGPLSLEFKFRALEEKKWSTFLSFSQHIQFNLEGSAAFDLPQLFYTVNINPDWRERNWKEVKVEKIGDKLYSANLPENGQKGIYWFALVNDKRELTVSNRLQHTKLEFIKVY